MERKAATGDDYFKLLEICLTESLRQSEKELNMLKTDFSEFSKDIHKRMEEFKKKVGKVPLIVVILSWADLMHHDKVFGMRYLKMMREIIEKDLLCITSSKNTPILLQDFATSSPSEVIDYIRCSQDWTISKREDYVLFYRSFSSWLSKETFGFVPAALDIDRSTTQKRQVPFDLYIDILDHLDLREQILAKIFYLRGRRNLEEVLSLKIEDVDFHHNHIKFAQGNVSYPKHLTHDIKRYVKDRKKGLIFIGRDGERIAHTTPFRALKTVISELKQDPEFTFKNFSIDV
jgi:hypothetical protein